MNGPAVSGTVIRPAAPGEAERLADLWYRGWQDAHAGLLPEALARQRTLESFRERMVEGLDHVRVADRAGAVAGFAYIKGDELYQMYVDARARGTGTAALLMKDAIQRFREAGTATAWLACAIGNERAARFYEKSGWHRACVMTSLLPTPAGDFSLDVWRYEIALG